MRFRTKEKSYESKARKMDLMYLLGPLLLVMSTNAWICGDDGQCMCTYEGGVTCQEISSAPSFPLRVRSGRNLTVQATKDFDLSTLDDTYGFSKVTLLGMTYQQCLDVDRDFPWVLCLSQGHETMMTEALLTTDFTSMETTRTDSKETTTSKIPRSGTNPIGTISDDNHETTTARMSPWAITGLVTAGLGLFILILCILVSLVNLHERLNLRTRSDDNAVFAVYCCKVLLALCLVPVHLGSKCCDCNWRGVRDLDNEMRLV